MHFLFYRKGKVNPEHIYAKNRTEAERIAKEKYPNEYISILCLG